VLFFDVDEGRGEGDIRGRGGEGDIRGRGGGGGGTDDKLLKDDIYVGL
jgi:hypothetical protein